MSQYPPPNDQYGQQYGQQYGPQYGPPQGGPPQGYGYPPQQQQPMYQQAPPPNDSRGGSKDRGCCFSCQPEEPDSGRNWSKKAAESMVLEAKTAAQTIVLAKSSGKRNRIQ
ncbi:hypothetical protein MBM_03716 [Drepanopeziza brunnea f. sp. 'multigermtubi' MB_m1]|uniref:Uncharacterized protein n=1 Tax=Marssonina brunnea f. sp. multigermtubi (strain MB_m1) TaxID=1072389 RepID=K1XYM6_MARBU|nr:uncharacterized protein MBM_03716 [Drepanopeziza brunnea f. sp. 'multigermtubi' MB_m1]EKD17944.1 hypothetical protein MBM_03716 [Drepanopeziza brunnea f. sp. 'multigermtubi' MB_m1]